MGPSTAIAVAEKDIEGADILLVNLEHADPEHPHNWPMAKKVRTILILGLMNILATVASSILSPGQTEIMQEFNIEKEVAILTTTLFLIVWLTPLC